MNGMTSSHPYPGREALVPYRLILWALARGVASTAVLVTIYYVLPLDTSSIEVTITLLVIGLAILIAVVIAQVRAILLSPRPTLRAVEAFAVSVPFFLLLFAAAYFTMERISPGSFGTHLTRTDALYFTVTVFATVGFGDITPKSEIARLVVTGQMVADLVIVGLAVKAILGALQQRRNRPRPEGVGNPSIPPHARQ